MARQCDLAPTQQLLQSSCVRCLGAAPSFNVNVEFTRGSAVAVGDLDGDGSAEVALGLIPSIGSGPGTIQVLSGSGRTMPELQLGNRAFFPDDRLDHRSSLDE